MADAAGWLGVRMRRFVLLASILSALPGCALLRPQPATGGAASPEQLAAWKQRVALLSPMDRFTLQGRVANSAIGFKADLRWRQQADGRYAMRVAGPFGARAAELAGDLQQVTVRTGDDATTVTTDPEAWLEQALGVRLPVNGLRWWALGLPAPGIESSVEFDPLGRASRIVQDGWILNYLKYASVEGLDLPQRIEANYGDTRVIVLADRWTDLSIVAPPG